MVYDVELGARLGSSPNFTRYINTRRYRHCAIILVYLLIHIHIHNTDVDATTPLLRCSSSPPSPLPLLLLLPLSPSGEQGCRRVRIFYSMVLETNEVEDDADST